MPGHSARTTNPLTAVRSVQPPLPAWFKRWLAEQGKWVRLYCGCIQDVHLPSCIELLTGKSIQIMCDEHGFQRIRKTLKFSDVIREKLGIDISDNTAGDNPLF